MKVPVSTLLTVCALGLGSTARAQQQDVTVVHQESVKLVHTGRTAHNAVYLELGGNGIFYSLNYERFLSDALALRIGIGYFSISASSSEGDASVGVLWLPIMVNYLGIGGLDHKMELGIGVLPIFASGSADTLAVESSGSGVAAAGTASIAYRYVPHDGGFNFKIGLTPLFGSFGFLPWLGIAFGVVT